MNCDVARALFPEHALGVSGVKGRAVTEHLAWCAACRKEAGDLERAAATLAFALAPAEPPAALGDAVLERVRTAAGVRSPRTRQRPWRSVVAAAMLALLALGGGVVMAVRDAGPDPRQEAERPQEGLDALDGFFQATKVVDGETTAALAVLLPTGEGTGGGSAMTILAPSIRDRAIVVVSGLSREADTLPYTAWLADAAGSFVRVGRVEELTSNGGFTVAKVVKMDLSRFVNVLVRDGRGRVVLSGSLSTDASLPSDSP